MKFSKSISLFFVLSIFSVLLFAGGFCLGSAGTNKSYLNQKNVIDRVDGTEVRTYYSPKQGFYLGVKDGEVIVYYPDQQTVYFDTGIMLEQFPSKLQDEIRHFYYIESDTKLFGFLESYSS